jgi:hypothetical protein
MTFTIFFSFYHFFGRPAHRALPELYWILYFNVHKVYHRKLFCGRMSPIKLEKEAFAECTDILKESYWILTVHW